MFNVLSSKLKLIDLVTLTVYVRCEQPAHRTRSGNRHPTKAL